MRIQTMVMRTLLLSFILPGSLSIHAQTAVSNFIDYQKSFPKISDVLSRKEDLLVKEFAAKGLTWPAKQVYIRSFKYDSQLEVWVRNDRADSFVLFKTYKVCALSGSMGPKRMQGDYQVPEGFYYINEFNPRSSFHLSLGINYPNLSDRLLSDSRQPGGDIYIHGSCVTTGCIPITDSQIEELYILTAHAKNLGQDFIPVHIFPVNFKNSNSEQYLAKYLQAFADYNPFVSRLKEVFLYFEKYRRLPVIAVNNKGEYVTNIDPEEFVEAPPVPKKQFIPKKRTKVHFDESTIPTTVNNLPVYPGGNEAFQEYLKTLSTELAGFLDGSRHTEYVMVEFIVDSTGKVLNPEVIKGGNDEMNEKILDSFERMPQWKPALRQDKPVPMKLKQTIVVEKL